jgi:limonene 1,2-monooxygenase
MFLVDSREELDRLVARRLPYAAEYSAVWATPDDDLAWTQSPKATIDHWREQGMTIFGRGTFGAPEEAIARIELLQKQTGGFGTFLILLHDLAVSRPRCATSSCSRRRSSRLTPHGLRSPAVTGIP